MKNKDNSVSLFWAIFVAGVVLRTYNIAEFDIWFDEAQSVFKSIRIHHTLIRIHTLFQAPLYYSLLHFWIKLFAHSLVSIRSFSWLFSCLTIPMVYVCAKSLFNKRTAIISMFIIASSPLHVWYAQEARAYSLAAFFFVCSSLSIINYVKQYSLKNLYTMVFCIPLAFLSSYYAFPLLCILPFVLLDKRGEKWHKAALSIILICMTLVIYSVAARQLLAIENRFWLTLQPLTIIPITLSNFVIGYNGPITIFRTTYVFLVTVLSIGLWKSDNKKTYALLLSLSLIPMFVIYILSHSFPVFLPRQFIVLSPLIYIALGHSIASTKKEAVRVIFISWYIVLILLPLYNLYSHTFPSPEIYHLGVHKKTNFRPAITYIKKSIPNDAFIAHTEVSSLHPFLYYLYMTRIKNILIVHPTETDTATESYLHERHYGESIDVRKNPLIPYSITAISEDLAAHGKEIWVVVSPWGSFSKMSNHTKKVIAFIHSRYSLIQSKKFENILIYQYRLTPGEK